MQSLNTPPMLLGASLLFWGWQSQFLWSGIVMAAVIEGARFVPVRWELSEKDFRRIWDFCSLLFVGAVLYAFTSNEGPGAVMGFFRNANPATQRAALEQAGVAALVLFRWLPPVFFLLVAAQAYSNCPHIPWTVFSWFLRRSGRRESNGPSRRGLNTAYGYFAVCLFGASITTDVRWEFYGGLCLLLGWALWGQRPKRYGAPVWIATVSLTVLLGIGIQVAFVTLNRWGNLYSARWLAQFMVRGFNPKETRTALGEVGRIKLSGKIVLRVTSPNHRPPPPLLREASYRFFKFPTWAGAGKLSDFTYIQPETNQTTWEFLSAPAARGVVRIAQYLTGRGEDARRGLLALPQGIVRLEHLPAFLMSTNNLGVVRVDEGPGLVIYDAYYLPNSTIDSPPAKRDLEVPKKEQPVLSNLVTTLKLAGLSPERKLRALAAFFAQHFQYSPWLPEGHRGQTNLTALGNFLLHDRAGHCEYFATAATLLLRQAGVPARYAVGYAVQERKGDQYVVRQRHAHAWCLAWVGGGWRDFDVTPASWFDAEAQRASWLEFLSDAWSRVWFEFSKWRWGQTAWRKYLLWIMVPVLVVLLARLFYRKQWKRFRQKRRREAARAALPGAESEFYLVAQALARRGWVRRPGEPWSGWCERVVTDARYGPLEPSLRETLQWHYRYRFDPLGLGRRDREKLRQNAERCLQELKK